MPATGLRHDPRSHPRTICRIDHHPRASPSWPTSPAGCASSSSCALGTSFGMPSAYSRDAAIEISSRSRNTSTCSGTEASSPGEIQRAFDNGRAVPESELQGRTHARRDLGESRRSDGGHHRTIGDATSAKSAYCMWRRPYLRRNVAAEGLVSSDPHRRGNTHSEAVLGSVIAPSASSLRRLRSKRRSRSSSNEGHGLFVFVDEDALTPRRAHRTATGLDARRSSPRYEVPAPKAPKPASAKSLPSVATTVADRCDLLDGVRKVWPQRVVLDIEFPDSDSARAPQAASRRPPCDAVGVVQNDSPRHRRTSGPAV